MGLIPFHEIPKTTTVPDNLYRLRVEEIKEVYTKDTDGRTPKRMFKLQASIVEPETYKGEFYFDQFCVGTEEDPEAEEKETWKRFSAREFIKLIDVLGVPYADEEDAEPFFASCKKAEYVAMIVEKVEPRTRKDRNGNEYVNPYAGQVRNATTAYYKLGEKEPGSHVASGSPTVRGKKGPSKGAKAATQAAKAAADDRVTCVEPSCRKRVPRSELKEHVAKHFEEMQEAAEDDE